MEMFKKEFGKESNHPSRWAAQSYWERKRKQFMDSQDLRYDDFTEDDTEITEDLDSENEKEIPRFYKLEDHLVDNFVMVKKKKKRKKI
uniref:DUF1604 domain-containing protein n=1 Tax=Caenorhabditis tropicalis TaxID=1561998 RepID=A0A1I7U2H3_9PELO